MALLSPHRFNVEAFPDVSIDVAALLRRAC